jgi:hypothetical protein
MKTFYLIYSKEIAYSVLTGLGVLYIVGIINTVILSI